MVGHPRLAGDMIAGLASTMRFRGIILSLALLSAIAAAQDHSPGDIAATDPHQAQVQAATTDAAANLREQVLQTALGDRLRVADFLQQTEAQDELSQLLQSAQPVGGARWVDGDTCQVRLEIPANKVSALLSNIAGDPHRHAPLGPGQLKSSLKDWKRLQFCAVGSSAGGDIIAQARPRDEGSRWSTVSDSARRSAVAEARTDAAHHLVESMNDIALTGEVHASEALAHPAIADHLNHWLQRQPVTRIEFHDDLHVTVTLGIAPRSLAAAFKSAVDADRSFKLDHPIDWDHVRSAIAGLPASVQGSASVAAQASTTLPSIVLPLQPPDWVDQQLQAEATATGAGSRLKIGRIAEARAVASIRDQILALHVDAHTTLGEAAKSDPQLSSAIDRTLLEAHTSKVDYLTDGTVKVRVTLDLQQAWDQLRAGIGN